MHYFIKSGFWEFKRKAVRGELDLSNLINSSTSIAWGAITGTLANQTDLNTQLSSKLNSSNSTTTLVDGVSVTLTSVKNLLTSSQAAITFSITSTTDDVTLKVILNATTTTYTFPAGSLCVSEGVSSGNNTLTLNGTSGDTYILSIKSIDSKFYIVAKNFSR